MATGKYLSLGEALKEGKLKEFAKAHPSTGDRSLFTKLLDRMVRKPSKVGRTSKKG